MVPYARTLAVVVLLATSTHAQAIQPINNITSDAPTVDLGYVKYQGITNATAGINYFRGIQLENPRSATSTTY